MKLAITPTLLYTALVSALLGIALGFADPGYMPLWQATFSFIGLFTLSLTVQQFSKITGNKSIISFLAILLTLGGGYTAYTGWEEFFSCLHCSNFSRLQLNGAIGQPNLFGSLLLISWLSAIYLFSHIPQRWMRYLAYFAALIFFGAPLPFTGSRTVLLSLIGVLGISTLSYFFIRTTEPRRVSSAVVVAMLIGLVAQFSLPPTASHFLGVTNRSTLNRIEAGGISASQRLRTDEWKKSFETWMHHPVHGVGVGRYAYQSFILQQLPPYNEVPRDKVYDHSHNLFTQLAAETGSIGLLLTVLLFATWFLQQIKTEKSAATILCWGGLTVLFIHSNLEFPLWYWYLLIPFTIMLATTERAVKTISLPSVIVPLIWIAGVGATGWATYMVYQGSLQINEGYSLSGSNPNQSKVLGAAAVKNPFVSLEADQMLSYLDSSEEVNVASKLARNTRLLYWRPYASVVYRRSILLAQMGQVTEAKRWIISALSVYPNERNEYFEPLLASAKKTKNILELQTFYQKALIVLVQEKQR